jgi:hypothetical protein
VTRCLRRALPNVRERYCLARQVVRRHAAVKIVNVNVIRVLRVFVAA